MKENHDYVTMSNYESDMAEVSDRAREAVTAQKRQITELENKNAHLTRMCAALVLAAGGRVEITPSIIDRCRAAQLHQWHDPANDTYMFQVKE